MLKKFGALPTIIGIGILCAASYYWGTQDAVSSLNGPIRVYRVEQGRQTIHTLEPGGVYHHEVWYGQIQPQPNDATWLFCFDNGTKIQAMETR